MNLKCDSIYPSIYLILYENGTTIIPLNWNLTCKNVLKIPNPEI